MIVVLFKPILTVILSQKINIIITAPNPTHAKTANINTALLNISNRANTGASASLTPNIIKTALFKGKVTGKKNFAFFFLVV